MTTARPTARTSRRAFLRLGLLGSLLATSGCSAFIDAAFDLDDDDDDELRIQHRHHDHHRRYRHPQHLHRHHRRHHC